MRLFTPAEQAAFVELKRMIKDEGRGIISAQLTLFYSAVPDKCLPEMIRTVQDSSEMEAALRALDRVGFPAYWAANAKPKIDKRIAELSSDLPKYNIIPAIEKRLGFPLASDAVTVYLLAYSEPHGIRITGLRFITHVSYPFRIFLHNAIHELMHPPFLSDDPGVREAVGLVSRDPLVVDKVEHHDLSFGYNSAGGLIEEDAVQALEQIVSEQFAADRNACQYWKQQDGGMHVLAPAICLGYKEALAQGDESFSKWFTKAAKSGQTGGDRLKKTLEIFFSAPDCR